MNINLSIGSLLQLARKQKKLTLAQASEVTGISSSWIRAIERNSIMSLPDYLTLCQAYQVCFSKLIHLASGKTVPSFANREYSNEKLNQLDNTTAALIHSASNTLPENSTDTFWLGTLLLGQQRVQVQLHITSEPANWIDEN